MMFILTMGPTVYRHECVTLPLDISPQYIPPEPPRQFPSLLRTFLQAINAKIWKLALNRTPDPNRSASINSVHVNVTI